MTKQTDLTSLRQFVKIVAPGGIPNFPAIFDHGTQIATWNREHGIAITASFIVVLLSDLCNQFNVYQPMTDDQKEDLSIEMAEDLWWCKMEDIAAFFAGCKKGKYGAISSRLDPGKVWEMWSVYLQHRNEAIEIRQSSNKTIIAMERSGGDSMENLLLTFGATFTALKNSIPTQ